MRLLRNLTVVGIGLLATLLAMCASPQRAPATIDPAVQATANWIYTENARVGALLTGTASAPTATATATRLNLQEALPTETVRATETALAPTDAVLAALPSETPTTFFVVVTNVPTAKPAATKVPTKRPATKVPTKAATAEIVPTRVPPTLTTAPPQQANCEPAYPDFCIPIGPDLDCKDIPHKNFTVLPPDPYRLDANHNGIGCES